ncbi:MAG: hypothetical protein C4K48_03025 [Candidatus Thorarchaeota archaeon]|nr:MAG: hypothetical protein C4K48_03025 [Candidatus Thorarchaeota archaeon]
MSTAKSAIDSTFRRILKYAAEIIISVILLVIICIPLAFTIPGWFQHVFLGTPRTELTLNLVEWFGYDGALWVTLLLGLISFSLGYLYISRMKAGVISAAEEEIVEEVPEVSEEEPEITKAEDVEEEEEIAAEDQEEDEHEAELDLEGIEDALDESVKNDEGNARDD